MNSVADGGRPGLRTIVRPTGASAHVGRTGHPEVRSITGGDLDIVTGASQPGFNPIDLLYASLSACLVLSARIAASRMGILDRLEAFGAEVTGEKTDEEPFRIARFDIVFTFKGAIDAETRRHLAHEAEAICTVSNTLRGEADITCRLAESV